MELTKTIELQDKSRQNGPQVRRRERVIAALLVTSTIEEAASSCRVSARTVKRMMGDEIFAKEYQGAKSLLLSETTAKLTSATAKAVETLRNMLDDADAPAFARLNAAVQIIRLAREGFYLEHLEERIRKLEEQSDAS